MVVVVAVVVVVVAVVVVAECSLEALKFNVSAPWMALLV